MEFYQSNHKLFKKIRLSRSNRPRCFWYCFPGKPAKEWVTKCHQNYRQGSNVPQKRLCRSHSKRAPATERSQRNVTLCLTFIQGNHDCLRPKFENVPVSDKKQMKLIITLVFASKRTSSPRCKAVQMPFNCRWSRGLRRFWRNHQKVRERTSLVSVWNSRVPSHRNFNWIQL